MIEQDEELRKLLQKWEAPAPGPKLDARVWKSLRRQSTRPRRFWYRVAAGVILAALALHLLTSNPHHGGKQAVNLETKLNADGFLPLSNGAITVLKAKEEIKQ